MSTMEGSRPDLNARGRCFDTLFSSLSPICLKKVRTPFDKRKGRRYINALLERLALMSTQIFIAIHRNYYERLIKKGRGKVL